MLTEGLGTVSAPATMLDQLLKMTRTLLPTFPFWTVSALTGVRDRRTPTGVLGPGPPDPGRTTRRVHGCPLKVTLRMWTSLPPWTMLSPLWKATRTGGPTFPSWTRQPLLGGDGDAGGPYTGGSVAREPALPGSPEKTPGVDGGRGTGDGGPDRRDRPNPRAIPLGPGRVPVHSAREEEERNVGSCRRRTGWGHTYHRGRTRRPGGRGRRRPCRPSQHERECHSHPPHTRPRRKEVGLL